MEVMTDVFYSQACSDVQARPAEGHRRNAYFGTITRHLLQDPSDGPPGTVPEEDVEITDTQSDAAYAPMSAMSKPHSPAMHSHLTVFIASGRIGGESLVITRHTIRTCEHSRVSESAECRHANAPHV